MDAGRNQKRKTPERNKSMMPPYQRFVSWAAWVLGGLLVAGKILDALGNAKSLTRPLSMLGTLLLMVVWGGTELMLRRRGVEWRITSGAVVRHQRLGIRPRLAFCGALLLLWIPHLLPVGETASNVIPQITGGGVCSPNLSNINGNVTIHFIGPACTAIDPESVRELDRFLADFPKTQRRLQELLDKKDVELAANVKEIEEWTKRYRELSNRLENQPDSDELSKRAAELLKQGELDKASALLDELVAKDEIQVDKAAQHHFNRAQAYELQFQSLRALPHYEKAYRYRPDDFIYGYTYATHLHMANRHQEAEPVYLAALQSLRRLPKKEQPDFRRYRAAILNSLGIFYGDMQRMKEAEDAYTEAVAIDRQLATENPVYRDGLANTLTNFGVLYRNTKRLRQAEEAYTEALAIRQELAKDNSLGAYAKVAATLNNLGILYRDTGRMKAAEAAHSKARAIRRELADRINGAKYRADLAATLNNLGLVYCDTEHLKEAENAYTESLAIRRKLSREDRTTYLPDVAASLNNLGRLYERIGRTKEADVAVSESIAMYREVERDNPGPHRPDLAGTLGNLGDLYSKGTRMKEARDAYTEALDIFRELTQQTPSAYGDQVARLLLGMIMITAPSDAWLIDVRQIKAHGTAGRFKAAAPSICKMAREAFAAAVSADLRTGAASLQREACGESK